MWRPFIICVSACKKLLSAWTLLNYHHPYHSSLVLLNCTYNCITNNSSVWPLSTKTSIHKSLTKRAWGWSCSRWSSISKTELIIRPHLHMKCSFVSSLFSWYFFLNDYVHILHVIAVGDNLLWAVLFKSDLQDVIVNDLNFQKIALNSITQ